MILIPISKEKSPSNVVFMNPNKPISIIVAVADHNAIGHQNELLCHLPADLKYFKQVTSGKTVIMGKRTWFSLPKRPLPNRRNIVLTDIPDETFPGAEMAYSIREAIEKCEDHEESFIIGGGMIYRQFFPIAQKLYITHIHHSFEADTYFEAIDPLVWEQISIEAHPQDEKNPFPYAFAVYQRRSGIPPSQPAGI